MAGKLYCWVLELQAAELRRLLPLKREPWKVLEGSEGKIEQLSETEERVSKTWADYQNKGRYHRSWGARLRSLLSKFTCASCLSCNREVCGSVEVGLGTIHDFGVNNYRENFWRIQRKYFKKSFAWTLNLQASRLKNAMLALRMPCFSIWDFFLALSNVFA